MAIPGTTDTTVTTGALEIRLNGRRTTVPGPSTLADLLRTIGKDPRTVAIERNGDIVRRAAFS